MIIVKHNPPDKAKEMRRELFLNDGKEISHDLRALQNSGDILPPRNMKGVDELEKRVLEILENVRNLRKNHGDQD